MNIIHKIYILIIAYNIEQRVPELVTFLLLFIKFPLCEINIRRNIIPPYIIIFSIIYAI